MRNETKKKILEIIKKNPNINVRELSKRLKSDYKNMYINIRDLVKLGHIFFKRETPKEFGCPTTYNLIISKKGLDYLEFVNKYEKF